MPQRLRREEVVTIAVLSEKGQNHSEIARTLGVTEGTVRYHLRRAAEGAEDGRKAKPFKAGALAGAIEAWHQQHRDRRGRPRPVNVQDLYEHLVAEHEYEGSYDSVLRYVRAKYPKPKMRTYRRVETPPGAQSQSDWAEFPGVALGADEVDLSAFVMTLSHCRKPAVVWSQSKKLMAWLGCHNGAYRSLAGVAAVNRIDNVRTAIASGAGFRGVIHPAYKAYARSVGFHIDACEGGDKEGKGKAEAKVRLARLRVDPYWRRWDALGELQEWTDTRIERWSEKAICPATGQSVAASWEMELRSLAPLPILPEPFDVAQTRPVHKDCMVRFEGRSYPVPFAWVGQRVEVRGCLGKVQILADGQVLREYPRGTAERVLIDPSCYEGEATDRVLPPRPLGKMGQRLQEIYDMPVELRPLDLYQALAEVAR